MLMITGIVRLKSFMHEINHASFGADLYFIFSCIEVIYNILLFEL
jgi:hypothetical protein